MNSFQQKRLNEVQWRLHTSIVQNEDDTSTTDCIELFHPILSKWPLTFFKFIIRKIFGTETSSFICQLNLELCFSKSRFQLICDFLEDFF